MFILKKLRFLEYSSYTLYILHFPIFYLQFSIMHKFVCDLHSFYALISVGFLVLANYLICILLGRFLENKKIFRPIIYKYLVRVLGSSI
jgi:peptidoglycan/LPS O-acetylase OafA/YrhL